MRGDTTRDRLLLWLAHRVPYNLALRLRWRVQDHRLDRAMARRQRAVEALHPRRRR